MPRKEDSRIIIKQDRLWATPVWYVTLNKFRKHETRVTFNEDLENYVDGLMKKQKGVVKSNVGGWQSDLLNPYDDTLKPLTTEIDAVCKNIGLDIQETRIVQMWINVNRRGDYNNIHQHSGLYTLSGTYYVKVPKDSGHLVLRDPRPGAIGNYFMNGRFDNGEFNKRRLNDGLLCLWPSYLDHFVEPNKTDEERISISFDVVVR